MGPRSSFVNHLRGDPSQKWFWGIFGAQVIDTKEADLPQNGLWWAPGRVLLFTCAVNPSQKCLWAHWVPEGVPEVG